MLSLSRKYPQGVNDINRRLFAIIILLITLLGSAGILYYSVANVAEDTDPKPAPKSNAPAFDSTIAGKNEAQLSGPLNLAVSDGLLFIADTENHRLAIYSQTGSYKHMIDLQAENIAIKPLGITVDKKRRLYVSVSQGSDNAILVFDRSGRFLHRFPEDAGNSGSFITPGKAMALFASGDKLYVTDIVDHDIKVYSLEGDLITRFGRPGSAKGEFLYPNGIVADESGKIFVSDSNNARVQVFAANGEFLRLFAQPGNDALALPRGMAFDSKGRLHVVDTLKHKVFVFTTGGRFLNSYGKFGTGNGGLSYPNGIAIDVTSGKIFIADKTNNRVSVWK
ncbi:MAG TPA: hypothetical protein DE036_10765 [Actinobacteria bacterium]|nr:hypothetical protein [Actinomycetota bacterium]